MFIDDTLNPRFVYHSFLRDGEELSAHVDRAIEQWQGALDPSIDREIRIDYLEPIRGAQSIRVDLWVDDLDSSSCVYGFLLSRADGVVAFARGERTLVSNKRWAPSLFERVATLRKDLPAYA